MLKTPSVILEIRLNVAFGDLKNDKIAVVLVGHAVINAWPARENTIDTAS